MKRNFLTLLVLLCFLSSCGKSIEESLTNHLKAKTEEDGKALLNSKMNYCNRMAFNNRCTQFVIKDRFLDSYELFSAYCEREYRLCLNY